MLKKHMAACLVVTAFVAAPAFAQTSPGQSGATDRPAAAGSGSTTTGSPAMVPGPAGGASTGGATMGAPSGTMGSSSSTMGSSTTTQGGSSSTMAQGGSMQGQFMTQMEPGQLMASDLIGTRVIGANNESIGDINDVIVDRNGQAVAAIVGVGGFLGIGEKDVAVPFNALEFASGQQASAMTNNNGAAPATTGSTAAGSATTGVAGGSAGGASGASGSNAASDNQPERVILRMSKAELQAAPSFNADGNNSASNTSTGSAGVGGQPGGAAGSPGATTTTAPKQ